MTSHRNSVLLGWQTPRPTKSISNFNPLNLGSNMNASMLWNLLASKETKNSKKDYRTEIASFQILLCNIVNSVSKEFGSYISSQKKIFSSFMRCDNKIEATNASNSIQYPRDWFWTHVVTTWFQRAGDYHRYGPNLRRRHCLLQC